MAVTKKSLISGSAKPTKSAPTTTAKMATTKIAAGKIATAFAIRVGRSGVVSPKISINQ